MRTRSDLRELVFKWKVKMTGHISNYLRILYLYLKQRYSIWFLLILLITIVVEAAASTIVSIAPATYAIPYMANDYVVFVLFLNLIILLTVITTVFFTPTYFNRSEAEFIFTTQYNPITFVFIKLIGDGVYLDLLLLVLTLGFAFNFAFTTHQLILIPLYFIDVFLIGLILSGLLLNLHIMSTTAKVMFSSLLTLYLFISTFLNIETNILFSTINPLPQYTPILFIIFLAMIIRMDSIAKEISLNIYGIHQGHDTKRYKSLFRGVRSAFSAIFMTSMYSQVMGRRIITHTRLNTLLMSALLSALFAILYGFIIIKHQDSYNFTNFIIYYIPFYVMLMSSLLLGSTLSFERPWINLTSGIDHMTYLRLRMNSRLLITYIVILPWVLTNISLYCLLRNNMVFLMVIIPLLSYPPILVPVSWLLMALSGLPQTRDVSLDYNSIKFNVSGMFSGIAVTVIIGILLMPILMNLHATVSWIILTLEPSLSVLTYMLFMHSGISENVWYWFVEKLSVMGYS
jgi:hypothetical protein